MKHRPTNDIAECCAVCEYSMRLDIRDQHYCKYKNKISEVNPEDKCRHFELDLLKLTPRPRRRVKFEL